MGGFGNDSAELVELPCRSFFFKSCVRKLQRGFGGEGPAEEHGKKLQAFPDDSTPLFT
jgi:hypothetical protein